MGRGSWSFLLICLFPAADEDLAIGVCVGNSFPRYNHGWCYTAIQIRYPLSLMVSAIFGVGNPWVKKLSNWNQTCVFPAEMLVWDIL